MVTVDGMLVEVAILPGSLSDVSGLAHLPFALPSGAQVAADAAYTYYEWEDMLAKREQISLLVGGKRNSKR